MKKKSNRKLNSFMYKSFTLILINDKFAISLFLFFLGICFLLLHVTSQLKKMVLVRTEIAIFQITLLGILVTSYVFLLNVVRKRESYDYARENTRIVIRLISCRVGTTSAISIITAVLMYFAKTVSMFALVLFSVSMSIMLIKLLLIILIIDHQWLFFYMALKKLRDDHKEMLETLRKSKPPMIKIFQRITDLEQMVKQVYKNHAYELADYFSPQDSLGFIAKQKEIPDFDLSQIDDYIKLLECKNNTIIINRTNGRDVSEIIDIELTKRKVKDTEKFFLTHFFSNEYFRKLTFTEKNFNEANFNATMFEGCVFNSVSLKGANCQDTDFSGSKFIVDNDKKLFDESTKLKNAKFDGVQFSGLAYTPDTSVEIKSATFRKANFYSSKLKNLEFELAVFDGASFFYSEVIEVGFLNTSLNEVNFSEAFIEKSNYEYAFLSNAIFYRAKLKNCNFCGATLKFVEFNEAILENSKLTNTVCDDASFSRAILKNIDFANASLNNAVFTESELHDVNLSYAVFKNSFILNIWITTFKTDSWNLFIKAEFNHTRFVCKKIEHTKHEPAIQRSRFKNALFFDAYLMGYTISDSEFEHSTFLDSRLSDIIFENTPFSDMVFNNVRMISVEYKSTQNEKGIMKGLKFKKCEFDQVKFTNIQIKNATFIECEFLTPEQVFFGVELNNVKFIRCSFPTNKSYRDFFRGTNAENMNKSERKKYVEILTDQKNDLADENDGRKQPTNETT